MAALLVGYARCSTELQDLTAQRDGLLGLGVDPLRVCVDHGLTGTGPDCEALAAGREGDTLVVTKLFQILSARQWNRGSQAGQSNRLARLSHECSNG